MLHIGAATFAVACIHQALFLLHNTGCPDVNPLAYFSNPGGAGSCALSAVTLTDPAACPLWGALTGGSYTAPAAASCMPPRRVRLWFQAKQWWSLYASRAGGAPAGQSRAAGYAPRPSTQVVETGHLDAAGHQVHLQREARGAQRALPGQRRHAPPRRAVARQGPAS